MNTAYILRKWAETETTVAMAKRTGIERSTISRHISGLAPVLPKHLAAYLESAPPSIRAELVGAFLRDVIPPGLQSELLGDGGAPLPHVAEWSASPDSELLDRMTFLVAEAMRDPELRRLFVQFADWMGFEHLPSGAGEDPDAGDSDPPPDPALKHRTSTGKVSGSSLLL